MYTKKVKPARNAPGEPMYLPIPIVAIVAMLAAAGLLWLYDGLRSIRRVPQLEDEVERRIAALDRQLRAVEKAARGH